MGGGKGGGGESGRPGGGSNGESGGGSAGESGGGLPAAGWKGLSWPTGQQLCTVLKMAYLWGEKRGKAGVNSEDWCGMCGKKCTRGYMAIWVNNEVNSV